MADYQATIRERPVRPPTRPGEIVAALPASPPDQGEDFEAILEDFRSTVMPGVLHWNHPGFFAYFPANTSGPGILGEMLSATLGVNGMLWETCPAATELEQVTMAWLRQLIGLPETFTGVIQDTASTSSLVALLQARERSARAAGAPVNDVGFAAGAGLTVYTSAEAHSSIVKGARIAGFGDDGVRLVATDDALALDPRALQKLVQEDRAAGRRPCAVVTSVGTTSTTAVDPLAAVCDVAEAEGLFHHVDAALAGSAAILPEMRHHFEGYERADSFVFNPHKWLFTTFDCSAHFVRDPDELQRTFAITPEYLKSNADGAAPNFRDWGVALGRRFRALKLWFVLRYHGAEGLRAQLRRHLELTRGFVAWVDEHPELERLSPAPFIAVCFRAAPRDGEAPEDTEARNQRFLEAAKAAGPVYLTHTRVDGVFCLRVSIGQTWTGPEDVATLRDVLAEALVAAI
jgi:aromatic-L-amino-acid decarboxylase